MGIGKFFANLSVVKKIYVLIAVAIIPISMSTFGTLAYLNKTGEEGNLQMFGELADRVAKNLDNFLDEKKYKLEEISKNEQIVNLLSVQDKSTSKSSAIAALNQVKKYISSKKSKSFLSVVNIKGECLISCDTLRNIRDIKNLPVFKEALEGNTYVSPRIGAKSRTERLISHSVQSKGEIIGVVILKLDELDEKYIWDDFLSLLDEKQKTKVKVILADNKVMMNKNYQLLESHELTRENNEIKMLPSKIIGEDIEQVSKEQNFAKQVIGIKPKYLNRYKYNQRIYASTILRNQNWIIGISLPESEIFSFLIEVITVNVVIVAIIIGITIFVALYIGNTISQPIRILIKAAQAIDTGDFEQVAETANYMKNKVNDNLTTKAEKLTKQDSNILVKTSEYQNDLGQLMRVFIKMARNVKEREQNLQKQVEKLHIKLAIDEEKKETDVKNLTENESFEKLKSTVNILKSNRKNLSCIIIK